MQGRRILGCGLMHKITPSFGKSEKIARYVAPENRQKNRRAKIAAFIEDNVTPRTGLSVNSLEVHTENQIASIYEKKFGDARPLGIAFRKISDVNTASADANITVQWDDDQQKWQYERQAAFHDAYRHDKKATDDSHSLCRMTMHFDDHQDLKFARRIASKPTYKML